jgi:hypothetical protein
MIHSGFDIPLVLQEQAGITRKQEPVTIGIPLPKGATRSSHDFSLTDSDGNELPLQAAVASRWSDGSLKWILLDFFADAAPQRSTLYRLRVGPRRTTSATYPKLSVTRRGASVEVDTGVAVFELMTTAFGPFSSVKMGGVEIWDDTASGIVLTDDAGVRYVPHLDTVVVESAGPIRATIRLEGSFRHPNGGPHSEFFSRLHFFAGTGSVRLSCTLRNPRAARHPRGLWDLGDPGSVYFKDLALAIGVRATAERVVQWIAEPWQPTRAGHGDRLEIYQDSSGGPNWQSRNHVNRFGQVPNRFRGYHVMEDGVELARGERATPIVALSGDSVTIAATIEQFWQNFPKRLEIDGHTLRVGLFPDAYRDVFELQGGEQKTHVVWLFFGNGPVSVTDLQWVHHRLIARSTPDWYAESKVFPFFLPSNRQPNHHKELAQASDLINSAVEGDNTFFDRRELIDEYGWRHFGDLYADHEAVNQPKERPLIAHYNNQYDVICGALLQWCRTGDSRWFTLADDLAKHVIDIDIYHTREDRSALNGGLFWHTDHYTDAGTATHRAYSRTSPQAERSAEYGGGPACEHNYTTGLLYYYYLTGNPQASDAVITLADWVINMDDGSKRTLGFLDPRPTGYCTVTATPGYHGPGRGAGNSINALIDAYALTGAPRYLDRAEQLIRRCIHPNDDVEDRQLDDVERRWSYTVFLSALGRYLDLKVEQDACDYMYAYARASLIHYARWMLDHEVPYKSVLHKVEIPTETWPAQDIRKATVFHWAAKHSSGPRREQFRRKASFFFNASVTDLLSFPTHRLTRPIVILLGHTYIHAYCLVRDEGAAPEPLQQFDFGRPRPFKYQFYELYRARDAIRQLVRRMKYIWSRTHFRPSRSRNTAQGRYA